MVVVVVGVRGRLEGAKLAAGEAVRCLGMMTTMVIAR